MRENLEKVESYFDNFKRNFYIKKGKLESEEERLEHLKEEKVSLEKNDLMYREELAVILKANAKQLELAADSLASAANHSIPVVFGSDYERLAIELDSSGQSTIAEIKLYKYDNGEIYSADPYEDNGGGVCDVASSLLKLGALEGYYPDVENALICDEPSKHVSGQYREGLARVFREMSYQTDRQIIMVSHDPAMTVASDHIVKI